jgi:hypothetical protein
MDMAEDERLEMLKSIYDLAYSIVLTIEKFNKIPFSILERRELTAEVLTEMFTKRDIDFDWTFSATYDSMLNYYKDATTH